jgi:hypothetical protein
LFLHYKFDSKLDLGFHGEREKNDSIIERELVLSLALMVVINVGVKICFEKILNIVKTTSS